MGNKLGTSRSAYQYLSCPSGEGKERFEVSKAMWLDLLGRVHEKVHEHSDDGIDVRLAKIPSYHQAWTQIFTKVFGIPSNCSDAFQQMVARGRLPQQRRTLPLDGCCEAMTLCR